MKIATYPFEKRPESYYYEFYSEGPNGKIKKVVEFFRLQELETEVFNLAFGDWDEDYHRINDLSISNNADRDKVLATVAATVTDFMEDHPDAIIIAWIAPDKRGYKFLTNTTTRKAKSNELLSTRLASGEDIGISVHTPAGESIELISGMGVFRNNGKVPALVLRQNAKEALFVWCISLDGKPVTLRSSRLKNNNGTLLPLSRACMISVKTGKGNSWTIYNNPDKVVLQNGTNEAFSVF